MVLFGNAADHFGTFPDWIVAACTILLAALALFPDTIRRWLYRPKFEITAKTGAPDCIAIPFTDVVHGTFTADTIHFRILVSNVGNIAANNAEVYAKALHRQRADGGWDHIETFPPMNLVWSDVGGMYLSHLAPKMAKHCDVAHVTDPSRRQAVGEDTPALGLTETQCALAFNLVTRPNHKRHIVGPGKYRLIVLVAADNVHPRERTIELSVKGPWDADASAMMRDLVGIAVIG